MTLPVVETQHNERYLRTKRDRLGHELTTSAESTVDIAPPLVKTKVPTVALRANQDR